MLVLLHCFKMEQKLNTAEGSKINTNPKIQIRVNSKNLKEAFQKLTDIYRDSISKKSLPVSIP